MKRRTFLTKVATTALVAPMINVEQEKLTDTRLESIWWKSAPDCPEGYVCGDGRCIPYGFPKNGLNSKDWIDRHVQTGADDNHKNTSI